MDSADAPEPLFRPESIRSLNNRFGSPVRPMGISSWLLTSLLLSISVAIAVFLCTAKYTRKETVVGAIEPTAGALRILAPRGGGTVTKVSVKEGDFVQANAPVISLDLDTVVEGGSALGDLLQSANTAQSHALSDQAIASNISMDDQVREITEKRAGLGRVVEKLRFNINLEAKREALQETTLEAYEKLHVKGFVSELDYQKAQIAVLQAKESIASLEKEMIDDRSTMDQLTAQLARTKSERAQAQAQLRESVAQLEEKRASMSAQKEVVLTAPQAGRVVALQATLGASVVPNAALAVILPEKSNLDAELWVPSKSAGFVKPGDRVRLLYDSFPYQRFGPGHGTVQTVAAAPTLPNELPIPIETKEALYRIVVNIDQQDVDAYGKSWRLIPGMRLTADLVLDQRPFWAWLADPLLAARRRAK